MPDLIVVVSGTTTGIGKTWMAARILKGLREKGLSVTARKPAQSFDPADTPTDADLLAAATSEDVHDVCPSHRRYGRALAPPMAAASLGCRPFSIADLIAELRLPAAQIALIEGVGGPRSPLAEDGDTATFARALAADLIVIVGPAALGAINAVRLSVDAFAPLRVVVVLNRYSEKDLVHAGNLAWLRDRDGLEVVTGPDQVASLLVKTLSTKLVPRRIG